MITFKQYLNEDVITHFEKDEMFMIDEMLDIIKSNRLYKTKVLFRGFKGARRGLVEVTNNRDGFYGAIDDDLKSFIKDDLKIKNPTFASGNSTQASMFGKVFVYVPYEKSTFYASDMVHDALVATSNASREELKNSYKSYNIKNMIDFNNEVIIDTKGYYLLDYMYMADDIRSKFFKKVNDLDSLTYGDIYSMLKSYKSYWQWRYVNTGSHSYEKYFIAKGIEKKI